MGFPIVPEKVDSIHLACDAEMSDQFDSALGLGTDADHRFARALETDADHRFALGLGMDAGYRFAHSAETDVPLHFAYDPETDVVDSAKWVCLACQRNSGSALFLSVIKYKQQR